MYRTLHPNNQMCIIITNVAASLAAAARRLWVHELDAFPPTVLRIKSVSERGDLVSSCWSSHQILWRCVHVCQAGRVCELEGWLMS